MPALYRPTPIESSRTRQERAYYGNLYDMIKQKILANQQAGLQSDAMQQEAELKAQLQPGGRMSRAAMDPRAKQLMDTGAETDIAKARLIMQKIQADMAGSAQMAPYDMAQKSAETNWINEQRPYFQERQADVSQFGAEDLSQYRDEQIRLGWAQLSQSEREMLQRLQEIRMRLRTGGKGKSKGGPEGGPEAKAEFMDIFIKHYSKTLGGEKTNIGEGPEGQGLLQVIDTPGAKGKRMVVSAGLLDAYQGLDPSDQQEIFGLLMMSTGVTREQLQALGEATKAGRRDEWLAENPDVARSFPDLINRLNSGDLSIDIKERAGIALLKGSQTEEVFDRRVDADVKRRRETSELENLSAPELQEKVIAKVRERSKNSGRIAKLKERIAALTPTFMAPSASTQRAIEAIQKEINAIEDEDEDLGVLIDLYRSEVTTRRSGR